MSAIVVCGKRSNFFEDTPSSSSSSSSPPVSKRIRYSSTSPGRFSPPRTITNTNDTPSLFSSYSSFHYSLSHLDHLAALFSDMDKQLLKRALEESSDDLDSAIRSLTELRLGSTEKLNNDIGQSDNSQEANVHTQSSGTVTRNGEDMFAKDTSAPQNLLMDGAKWVDLFVREMMSASDMDDARNRASRALEFLEKSIFARASAEATQGLQQENNMLKEQLQALVQENSILKRVVSIQHESQKEFEDRSHELQNMKQMASQYQKQLKNLEIHNYALALHLKQARQNNSLPGRFPPDVF